MRNDTRTRRSLLILSFIATVVVVLQVIAITHWS
jgi:hypothetical protein